MKNKPPLFYRWWVIVILTLIIPPLGLILLVLRISWNGQRYVEREYTNDTPKSEARQPTRNYLYDHSGRSYDNKPKNVVPANVCGKRFPTVPDRDPDWTLRDETLCVLSGQEPPEGAFKVGDQVYFLRQPDNSYDHRAVRFVNASGVQGGYLYRGQCKELVFDCLKRGDTVVGIVTGEKYNGDLIGDIEIYKAYPHTDLDVRAEFCIAGNNTIGERIRWTREARGLTQTAAAEAAGISRNLFGRYERGECVNPKLEDIDRIAAALGTSRNWIMDRVQH